MQRIQRLKNKKGFSLVELIIVIAIMAVLVGILAPQFTRYIERSRISADVQVVNSMASVMRTLVVDPFIIDAAAFIPITAFTVTWNTATGVITGAATAPAAGPTLADASALIQAEIVAGIGANVTPRSRETTAVGAVTLTSTFANGRWAITVTAPANLETNNFTRSLANIAG